MGTHLVHERSTAITFADSVRNQERTTISGYAISAFELESRANSNHVRVFRRQQIIHRVDNHQLTTGNVRAHKAFDVSQQFFGGVRRLDRLGLVFAELHLLFFAHLGAVDTSSLSS